MKKSISILVLLAIVSVGAFAADFGLSAGGGLLLDMSFGNGQKSGDVTSSTNNTSFGGFVFFDATYVEVDIGFAYGLLVGKVKGGGFSASDAAGSVMQLNFSLLGKYPIELGSVTLFPLLGVSYNFVLSGKDADGNKWEDPIKPADFSQFGILGGIGADFNLTDALYLRAEGLLQVRLPSKMAKDALDAAKKQPGSDDLKNTLGVGPVIKVALGFKF